MNIHKPQLLKVADLVPYPENPKAPIGSRYLKGLVTSMEHYGFVAGLIVTAKENPFVPGSHVVMDGNTRLEILCEKGAESVWCTVLPPSFSGSEAELRKFALSFDRTRAAFDPEMVVLQTEALLKVALPDEKEEIITLTVYEPLPDGIELGGDEELGEAGLGDEARVCLYSFSCTSLEKEFIDSKVGRIAKDIPSNFMDRVLNVNPNLSMDDIAVRFAVFMQMEENRFNNAQPG